jgi:hypothetical protein
LKSRSGPVGRPILYPACSSSPLGYLIRAMFLLRLLLIHKRRTMREVLQL